MGRALVALGLVAALVTPAAASPRPDLDLPPPPPAITGLRDRAAQLRALAAHRSPGAPLRALLAAAGHAAPSAHPPAAHTLLAGTSPRGPARPQLLGNLHDPITGLHVAVQAAGAMLAGATPADLRGGMAAITDHARRLGAHAAAQPDRFAPPVNATLPPAVTAVATRTPAATALIAAALDEWLPALARQSASPRRPDVDTHTAGPSTSGCDVHEALPYLCVGSGADNTYTAPAALLIDLGGDDTHLHPAGAAPFVAGGGSIMVSVTVDLGGDDRYVAVPIPGVTTTPAGQGYGALGGVGVLIDVAGNDGYEATAPATAPDRLDTAVAAQGIGFGAGYGALVDLAGDDHYRAAAPDGEGDTAWVYGQGLGYLYGGAGAVADLGAGNDRYELDAGTVHGVVREWTIDARRHNRHVQGQASSYTGTGLLVDDGGSDRFTATAHARATGAEFLLDPNFEPPLLPPRALVPLAAVWGQGAGIFGGSSYLLAGDGDTRYEAVATGDAFAQGSLLVQGFGFLGGAAAVDDRAGDDTYSARVAAHGDVAVVRDEDCACGPARAVLEPFVSSVSAQGWGGASGAAGALTDHAGDDAYDIANDQTVRFRVEDRRAQPPQGATADLSAWPPPAMGQGWATVAGAGALLDRAGTDAYRLVSRLDAAAAAQAPAATGSVATATVLPRLYALGGQGAARAADGSAGSLLDLAGSGDVFVARADTAVVTAPDPARVRTVGFLWPPFQGSGDSGVFAALGEAPTVLSSPSQGVCAASTGPRGFGTWSECALQGADADRQYYDAPAQVVTGTPDAGNAAVGLAPRASGRAPALTFTQDSATVLPAAGAADVGARLLSPDGAPIAGAPLRFDLQFTLGSEGAVPPAWFNGWEVVAHTDADGVAQAALPGDLEALAAHVSPGFPGPGQWRLRLLVSFEGAPGLHPRHVAQPLTAG